MTHIHSFEKRLLLTGILLGLAVRLWIAWQPANELSWRATADDAYYYFKLAQHLGAGAGATFDGVNPTNGFHPLYALLLVPIFQYVGNHIELGVNLALTLVALAGVATAWPIYLIGKYVHSPRAGVIGALVHLLNPWVVVLTMTGVESAVYVCCFAWTVMAYMRWRLQDRSLCGVALVGLLAGLTVMARSEGGLLLAGIILDLLILHQRAPKRAIACAALCGLSASVVCLPWAFWSISRFGTPFQISASAIMVHNYADIPSNTVAALEWYIGRVFWFIPRYAYKIVLFNLPTVLILGLLLVRALFTGQLPLKIAWPSISQLSFLILPFVFTSAYYNLILLHQQHWYFNTLVLIVTLTGAPIIAEEVARLKGLSSYQKYQKVAVAAMCCVFVVIVAVVWQRGLYPGQADAYILGRHIASSALRYDRIGATDSGIAGFFCRCTMVNLDGVMNNAAVVYYRAHGYDQKTIFDFARAQRVAYVWSSAPSPADEVRIVRRIRFAAGVLYQIR
ncbi:MAG: glycosyltransferase family 39 protein [Roseiflexus sp.]|nr:glycosyltransferase family 39 protein [Roseiflexus sp.]